MTASSTSSNLRLLILPSQYYSPLYVIAPAHLSREAAAEKAREVINALVDLEKQGKFGEEGYSASDVLVALSSEGFNTFGLQGDVISGTRWA